MENYDRDDGIVLEPRMDGLPKAKRKKEAKLSYSHPDSLEFYILRSDRELI